MERKVFGITMHVAENFGKTVTANLNVDTTKGIYTFERDIDGIIVNRAPTAGQVGTCKLIPWANLRGVDFYLPDGTAPVSPGNAGTVS